MTGAGNKQAQQALAKNCLSPEVLELKEEAMVMSDMIHLLSAGYIEQSGTAIDLYSKPRTLFAATFIGNYTILPAADFSKACGETISCENVAIRPEIVHMGYQPEEGDDKYHLRGRITNSMCHGNIIRYDVLCAGIHINVDVMFEGGLPLNDGEEVFLSINKEGIIEL